MNERLQQLNAAQEQDRKTLIDVRETEKRLETAIAMRSGRIAELQRIMAEQAEAEEPTDG